MQRETEHSSTSFEDVINMFSYDRGLSLDIEEISTEHDAGVSVRDIRYTSLADQKVRAYLVEPSGVSPSAGLFFVHPAPGNRSSFLEDATQLAEQGAVSLLLDAPWANGAQFIQRIFELFDKGLCEWYIKIAIDMRRGIDVLTTLSNVDANRIGYIGHSFGALFGGVIAGVENRIKSYVLMAGVGSFADLAVLNMPDIDEDTLEKHRQMMDPIDPVHYVGRAAPSALFFQFGLRDTFFAKQQFLEYYQAASQPKKIKWYDADHYLNDEARTDRIEWLSNELDLKRAQTID